MKLHYRLDRKSKDEYFVRIKVDLTPDEQSLLRDPGFYSTVEVGDRFGDRDRGLRIKGVDIIGNIEGGLTALMSGREYKFRSINPASDFISAVVRGLESVKEQIDGTRGSVDLLGKDKVVDF